AVLGDCHKRAQMTEVHESIIRILYSWPNNKFIGHISSIPIFGKISSNRKATRGMSPLSPANFTGQPSTMEAPMKLNSGRFTLTLLATGLATAASAQQLGQLSFKTSCTPAAQEKFDRGVAMVHSFFYPDSIQAFTEAASADPQCGIAHWGIAFSHRPNPLV